MFFRAEDAFGFTIRIIDQLATLAEIKEELREEFKDGSYSQILAMAAASGERAALVSAYGEHPDAQSHGESFLEMLKRRLRPPGLFLLDEPETPLSPRRQLSLLSLLMRCVAEGGQFVIATHSPILTALPGAAINRVEADTISDVTWEDVEHVSLTRAFLTNPESFLRHL